MADEVDTTQVNVKLPISMKQDWDDYVEDSEEVTSLSHLIRLAVQREINDEHTTAVDVDAVDIELDDVTQRLDTLEETLAEVRDTVTAMETGRLADEDQIEEIADRVYDTMPRRSSEAFLEDASDYTPRDIAQDLVEEARWQMEDFGSSIEQMANEQNWEYGLVEVYKEYFGVSDYEMQRALEQVQQYSSRVHVVDDYEFTVVFELE